MLIKWSIFALLLSAGLCELASADDLLDIKGFHAGMKGYELKGHLTDFCFQEGCAFSKKTPFTVGGVKGKFLAATYDSNGAADSIDFVFDSFGFEPLRAALIDKYPQSKCVNSEVITRRGIQVPQVLCRFETGKDGIYLIRAAGSINQSMMFVMSAEKREEVKEHVVAANRDL